MGLLFKLLYIFVTFGETIVLFRIFLSLISANQAHTFVSWIYSISDMLITPFEGIVAKEIYLDKFRIELTPIVALIFLAILSFILSELSKSLKRTD